VENLGGEMGLYTTPAQEMGRLSYDMLCTVRLIVDTGIHTLGWDRERAIRFMLETMPYTRTVVETEVDDIIANPGDALGAKVGALRIEAMRDRARRALGDRFDIRRFHGVVLEEGPLPLDLVDANVDAWIAAERQH
jgi:uncharacterized protein (DUF885 family)